MRGVFCFRNDLRLTDHPALSLALEKCQRLFLVYVFEDRIWKASSSRKMGPFRAKFILESLSDLDKEIKSRQGCLHYLHGCIEEEIPRFMAEMNCTHCFMQEEDAWEEQQTEKNLSKLVSLQTISGSTLIHSQDLPFEVHNLPPTFTQFRKRVEENLKIREPLRINHNLQSCKNPQKVLPSSDLPKLNPPALDARSSFLFTGGSVPGRLRMTQWFWEENAIGTYKITRNGLLGSTFSSRLSPWLAQGCLSPREIFFEIKNYEKSRGANESTYWLIFELFWRDYFHFVARKYGTQLFHRKGIHPQRPDRNEPKDSHERFDKWKFGATENQFVNANMNELRLSGWMSNRGRQNVASYLIHDLGLDWRWGAEWFERQLIDFDPCSNYGNWLYLSGYGNDPRPGRSFNLNKQAEIYDPTGEYQRIWSSANTPTSS
jgi:deoxyribodipyrimidine photo-lyase